MTDKSHEVRFAELSGEMKTTRDVLGVQITALTDSVTARTKQLDDEIEHNRNATKTLGEGFVKLLADKADKEDVQRLEAEMKLKAAEAGMIQLRTDFETHKSEEKADLKDRIEKYDARLDKLDAKKLDAKDWRVLTALGLVFGLCALILAAKAKEWVEHKPEPTPVVRQSVVVRP